MNKEVDPLAAKTPDPLAEQGSSFRALSGQGDCCGDADASAPPTYLSARATRDPNLSPQELDAAEAEAFEWAKRVNRC